MVNKSQQVADISRTPVGSTPYLPPGRVQVRTETWRDEVCRRDIAVEIPGTKLLAEKRTSSLEWKSNCQASQGQMFIREPFLPQSTLLNHEIATAPWKTRRDVKDTGLVGFSFCSLHKQLHSSCSLSGVEYFCPLPTMHRHLSITQLHVRPVRRIWSSSATLHNNIPGSCCFALSKEELSKQSIWF